MNKIQFRNGQSPFISDTTLNQIQDNMENVSVPSGGTTGQILAKASNTDNDVEWVENAGGETLPVGTELDFDGQVADIPTGWEETDDPNTYSTAEKKIGTWIDGEPIYRKVYSIGNLPNTTLKTVDTNLTNINLVDIRGIAQSSGLKITLPSARNSGEDGVYLWLNSSNQITIETGKDRSGLTGYVILEYTKITN